MVARWLKNIALITTSFAVLGGCAAHQDVADRQLTTLSQVESVPLEDPYENFNRAMFAFNDTLDTYVLRPVAIGYGEVVPDDGKNVIRNFLRNLSTPVVLLNDILQGNSERAKTTFSRFMINTTIGFAGLGDPASDFGYEHHSEDFGQTLAVWNNEDAGGSYIVLPVFGPSNPRDALGLVVDTLTDPLTWMGGDTASSLQIGKQVTTVIDGRYRLLGSSDSLRESTDDYYAAVKTIYEQNRDFEIRNGAPNLNLPAPGDDW